MRSTETSSGWHPCAGKVGLRGGGLMRFMVAALVTASLPATGQVTTRPTVTASGEGVVSFRPDLAQVNLGVTTHANSAQEAGDQNAEITNAVLNALRQAMGANATIRTVGYSLSPNYRTQPGSPPIITGYTANNTVEVTLSDLNAIGRVIDTAVQAGATNVSGIRFTLRDPAPARAQALRLATMQAKSHAEAIASGLGMRLGAVLQAAEGGAVRIVPLVDARAGAAATTPIEVGNLEVRATVSVVAELTP